MPLPDTGVAGSALPVATSPDAFDFLGIQGGVTKKLGSGPLATQSELDLHAHTGTYVPVGDLVVTMVAAPTGVAATDTAAIQSKLTAAAAGEVVQLQEGAYSINAPLTKADQIGVSLQGAGRDRTKLVGTAAMAGLAMVKFTNCKAPSVSDMNIYGESGANKPVYGIQSHCDTPTSQPATEMLVERVRFGGLSAAMLDKAIAFTAATDQNNDFATIVDCTWQNLTTCLSIEHSNSLMHRIIGGTVQSGVTNFVVLAGGSFHAYGTVLADLTGWLVDFAAGTYLHASGLTNVVTESVELWVRSAATINAANGLTFSAVGCELRGGTLNVNPIQWAAPNSRFVVEGGRLDTGQTGTKAVFSAADSRAFWTDVHIGLTGFDVAGALVVQGGVYGAGLPTMTNLGAGTVVEAGVVGARLGSEAVEFGRFGAGTGVGFKRNGTALALWLANALGLELKSHAIDIGHAAQGAGLQTETAGTESDIFNIGANDTRFGTVEATRQGGFLRFDTRAGSDLINFYGRPASGVLALWMTLASNGDLAHKGAKVGFNGSAPVVKQTLGAAATDAATTQTLANNLRTALINLGLGQT